MTDEGSKRRRKKRGRSLIFKTCFRPATSGDDDGGKILASDDNLVYCDVTSNANANIEPDVKKSSSSRGRMSRLFKAVLFDTAVKKKMRSKRSSKTSSESVNSSPIRSEKTDDSVNDVKLLEAETFSNETDVIPVASSSMDPSSNNNLQTLTERKVTPRVNSMDKKPPLIPSNSRPTTKPVHAKDNKHVALSSSKFRMYVFMFVVFLVLVILWWCYTAMNGVKYLVVDSNPYTNVVIVGDDL